MIGRTNASGGGVNYAVTGGTTQPNGRENLIWVNTEETITGHVFSTEEPGTPSEGLVWFVTGLASPVEFNAVKLGELRVYPLVCKQYVSGAWAQKSAKSYVNGAWTDWVTLLYYDGNEYDDLTGGWRATNVNWRGNNGTTPTFSHSSEDDHMRVSLTSGGNASGIIQTTDKINLTNYSKLCAEVNHSAIRTGDGIIAVDGITAAKVSSPDALGQFSADYSEERHVYTADISELSGLYYIGVRVSSTNSSGFLADCYKIWLE